MALDNPEKRDKNGNPEKFLKRASETTTYKNCQIVAEFESLGPTVKLGVESVDLALIFNVLSLNSVEIFCESEQ